MYIYTNPNPIESIYISIYEVYTESYRLPPKSTLQKSGACSHFRPAGEGDGVDADRAVLLSEERSRDILDAELFERMVGMPEGTGKREQSKANQIKSSKRRRNK